MSKTDKKITSIFLILIMFIVQITPVFAVDYNTGESIKSLESYLIENGVDANKDGALSEVEWGKVKNLILDGTKVDIS